MEELWCGAKECANGEVPASQERVDAQAKSGRGWHILLGSGQERQGSRRPGASMNAWLAPWW